MSVVVSSARMADGAGWVFIVEIVEQDGSSLVMHDSRSYRSALTAARELSADGAGPVVDRVMT